MFSKLDLRESFIKQITCSNFDFVTWIATAEEIRVLAIEIGYIIAENNLDLWLEPN